MTVLTASRLPLVLATLPWLTLAGAPWLFGSLWAANTVYALSSSMVLFPIGKLFLALCRSRR